MIYLRSVYHKHMVRGEEIPKTTFRITYAHYEFLVMAFGQTNSQADFIDIINRLLKDYLDDILAYYNSKDHYINYLGVVLHVIKEHLLFFKYSKCQFLLKSFAFLGHISIDVNRINTKAVKNQPTPLNLTNNISFLSLTEYYRSFVASITSLLTNLTKKSVKFEWLETY